MEGEMLRINSSKTYNEGRRERAKANEEKRKRKERKECDEEPDCIDAEGEMVGRKTRKRRRVFRHPSKIAVQGKTKQNEEGKKKQQSKEPHIRFSSIEHWTGSHAMPIHIILHFSHFYFAGLSLTVSPSLLRVLDSFPKRGHSYLEGIPTSVCPL